jgi:integrase
MTDALPPPPSQAIDALWRYFGPPPEAPRTDVLEELADRFVELKRSLGYTYETEGRALQRFLRSLKEHGVHRAGQLSSDVVRQWAQSRRESAPRAFPMQLQRVAVFLDHLKTIGKVGEDLVGLLRCRVPRDCVPYIFSFDELSRIFVPSRTGPLEQDHALIWRFIYACGLRQQEAAHLLIRDFDAAARTVFIRQSKFGKDRLVPVHPRIVDRLVEHIARSRRDTGPVFTRGRSRPYSRSSLTLYFKKHLVRLGIYQPDRDASGLRYMSTRLHSLRHSFAVHRLLKWYRDGADVQAKLPLLSTYMGHVNIMSTQVYLKITALLLREAGGRFSAQLERELPLQP